MALRSIDLFSGCGGIARGLSPFCEVVAYCECDDAARTSLEHNMRRGLLDEAPIYDDVRTFPAELPGGGDVDLVSMGFPCQDISTTGLQRGFQGSRSSLFHDGMRVVANYRPRFVFLENVRNITTMPGVWHQVLRSLDEHGYDARWGVVAAGNLRAPHYRPRWFCVAHCRSQVGSLDTGGVAAETKRQVRELLAEKIKGPWNMEGRTLRANGWEPEIPRMVAAARSRSMRAVLAQLGNICVPQCAQTAFEILRSSEIDVRKELVLEETHYMPHWGAFSNGVLYTTRRPPLAPRFDHGLVLLPADKPHRRWSRRKLPLVTDPLQRRVWATPRARAPGVGTLTKRTMLDLSTQMYHEERTVERGRCENPRYVEWMMGLPENWIAAYEHPSCKTDG